MKAPLVTLAILLLVAVAGGGYVWERWNTAEYELLITKSKLLSTETELENAWSELYQTQEERYKAILELSIAQAELEISEAELADAEEELATAREDLASTEDELASTRTEMAAMTTEMQEMEEEKEHMAAGYLELREQINLRLDQGTASQQYITPDDAVVIARAFAVAGNYTQAQDVIEVWDDFQRLYNWVVDNIRYSSNSYIPIMPATIGGAISWQDECWRTPVETLQQGTGDCEDMATLLASMILSYGSKNFSVWAIAIHDRQPGSSGHLAVVLPVEGNNLTILDPAGNYYTGYRTGRLRSYDVEIEIDDWLYHWSGELPGAYVSFLFSDETYREFAGTQEFIDWVKE
jgi:hypothetical protein